MSSAVVRACIAGIMTDEEFSLDTPRMRLAKQAASSVLELTRTPSLEFDAFAQALLEKLQPKSKTFGSRARRNMWSRFHTVRSSELEDLWMQLFTDLGVEQEHTVDPLLRQYVNDKALAHIIESKLSSTGTTQEPVELSGDELNVLRFVAGYIPFKLKKRIDKGSHPYKKEFLLCLNNMSSEHGSCEDSLEMYTKRWTSLISRGGLFQISDKVYMFFHSMEYEAKRHLKQLTIEKGFTKDYVVDEVMNDLDVQYHWSSISSDIDAKAPMLSSKTLSSSG